MNIDTQIEITLSLLPPEIAPKVKYNREWEEWQVWFRGEMTPCFDKSDAMGTALLIAVEATR